MLLSSCHHVQKRQVPFAVPEKGKFIVVCIGAEILFTDSDRGSYLTYEIQWPECISIEVAVGPSSLKISPTVHHYSRIIALRASIVEKLCFVSSVALLPGMESYDGLLGVFVEKART